MTQEELDEFLTLKERYLKALDYEKHKYKHDTPEGKEWALNTLVEIVERMKQLWEQLPEEEKSKHMDLFR